MSSNRAQPPTLGTTVANKVRILHSSSKAFRKCCTKKGLLLAKLALMYYEQDNHVSIIGFRGVVWFCTNKFHWQTRPGHMMHTDVKQVRARMKTHTPFFFVSR